MRRTHSLRAALVIALWPILGQVCAAQAPSEAPRRSSSLVRHAPQAEAEAESNDELLTETTVSQPGVARPPAPSLDATTRRATTSTRRPPTRLASVPNMFGDFFGGAPVLTASFGNQAAGVAPRQFQAQIVPPGGGRRAKIGEQNNPLPTDRIYFFYNHFHNAIEATNSAGQQFPFPIDRYTVGFEKTFFDGLGSVELRMPFSSSFDFVGNPANPNEFSTFGGKVGNLAIIPKLLLSESEDTAISAGLGIELPTGDDVVGRAFGGEFRFSNEAVHLSPFAAIMHQSSERLFWLGFLQFDLVASGNPLTVTDPNLGNAALGTYTDQHLCFVDLAGGYSFYVNPEARWLTRLSGQVELHYTASLQDADTLANQRGLLNLTLAPAANSFQLLNLTCALTGTLGENTFLRVATSAPLRDAPNRFFDSEIQAAVIQRF